MTSEDKHKTTFMMLSGVKIPFSFLLKIETLCKLSPMCSSGETKVYDYGMEVSK